ncbi:ras-related protein Rab-31 isoform X2 [Chroicocephalus ridibundus]|uniref:ras-related protein Rab-31 isoform X2 n=1 Tax=Chroicocephalus ridibundus TaxID=1192867 RepID=UPI002FDCF26B
MEGCGLELRVDLLAIISTSTWRFGASSARVFLKLPLGPVECPTHGYPEDTGVGKSSIVCRFVQDHFDHNISPTIGASFMTKTVPCGNELHKFLIWDTAGQERFHSLAPMYYRGSAAAVIVYDITKQDSFHTLKKWVKELKEHGPENIVMAIAGNKCDLSDIREVPMKDAKEYAESIGAIVVETSAKNAVNIEELFQGISQQIPPLDPHENGNNGAIKLGKQTSQTGRRCC